MFSKKILETWWPYRIFVALYAKTFMNMKNYIFFNVDSFNAWISDYDNGCFDVYLKPDLLLIDHVYDYLIACYRLNYLEINHLKDEVDKFFGDIIINWNNKLKGVNVVYKIRHIASGKFVDIKLEEPGIDVWAAEDVISGNNPGFGNVLRDKHKGWGTRPKPDNDYFGKIGCEVVRYEIIEREF